MTAIILEDRAAARRERNRLRSLRWRRAHGIGPRKPAQRPWLALGISRRRRAKARERAALAQAMAAREAVLDRLRGSLPSCERISIDARLRMKR